MRILETKLDLRVRYAETDQMGVVYHTHYLVWCEVGRTELLRAAGLPYAELEGRGFALAVSEAHLRYLRSARYDDAITVRTRVVGLRSRTVDFEYEIEKSDTGERLATASTTLICLDRSGRVTAIPDDVRNLLELGD